MKGKIKFFLLSILLLYFVGCNYFNPTSDDDDYTSSDTTDSVITFYITSNIYDDTSDWDQIVNTSFGSDYRVADWNDLVSFYDNGGNLLNLFDQLGLTEYGNSVFIKRSGDSSYSSDRFYYASRHEHNLPSNYLAHENIDNYLISLGSWSGSKKIMIVKEESSTTVTNTDTGRTYGDFAITSETYEDSSDWDQIINTVFGSTYRVADWNDLVSYYNAGNNLLTLYDGLGLTEYKNAASVTRSGDPSYSTDRYYYASRHEHNLPSNYLAHENIDNYLISLGSWSGSRKIMARKKY